jgi:hypothetical protein
MPSVAVVSVVAHALPMATISTCSQIPLADGRWKLAWHRGFYGQADRIQNHLFSLTIRGCGKIAPHSVWV